MNDAPADAPPPPKLDPEALEIRARPPAVIRFRRSAIAALTAAGTSGLAIVAWSALGHHRHQGMVPSEDVSRPQRETNGELATLPANYAEVPRLGPPLPGDLGRPILEQEQATEADTGRAAQADATRNEGETQARSARESAMLVRASIPEAPVAPLHGLQATSVAPGTSSHLVLDPAADPNDQVRKLDFVAASGPDDPIDHHMVRPPASVCLLSAGSVISASLITGLRSDLPGIVSAQVTENVYDSPTGKILLVPQGARLVGSYDSVVAFGQKRALVVWQRIVMPDGSSLALDSVPATDPAGYSGLEDKVDFHTWSLLEGVAISSLLGVGAELQFRGGSDLVEAVRASSQQNVARAGDERASRMLGVQPTITVRPGTPVRLVVHKDLILAPWRTSGDR